MLEPVGCTADISAVLDHQRSHIDGRRREALPGNVEDPKDSWDSTGVKTMAPEGAILSLVFDNFDV